MKIILNKWDLRFLDLACHVAKWSKDPSTKVGAVIIDKNNRIVGLGYNGFPKGIEDSDRELLDKELKHQMVIHAEINAILNSNKSVKGCTMYTTFFPCPKCASIIIQSGIECIVSIVNHSDERYIEQHKLSKRMFNEAGIEFHHGKKANDDN